MKITGFLILLLCCTLQGIAQRQGICGTVVWVSGNQMPGPGKLETKPQGIKRLVYIYQATRVDQTSQTGGVFFSNITTPFIRKVRSRKTGKFCANLPPGEYSIFILEKEGLFANVFDGNNSIQCIQVKKGEISRITIQVNYTAAY